jgi:hypothetical protein
MLTLLIQGSSFLELFIDSCEDEGCEDTALNWVLAVVVVSIICALLMLAIKWFKKYAAINLIQKAWSRSQTVMLIMVGLIPVLLTLIIIWYTTRNFFNYVGMGGLLKGVVFAWLLYVLMMFTGHLLSPWRREIL